MKFISDTRQTPPTPKPAPTKDRKKEAFWETSTATLVVKLESLFDGFAPPDAREGNEVRHLRLSERDGGQLDR